MLLLLLLRFNEWISKNYRTIKEKAMAPHSSTLAWKIPWMEEPGGLYSMWSLRVRHDWATSLFFSLSGIGEGDGNPLPCSCLENPKDGGAWWASVSGVAQSRTRLKQLSIEQLKLNKFLSSSQNFFSSVTHFSNKYYRIPIYEQGSPSFWSCWVPSLQLACPLGLSLQKFLVFFPGILGDLK